MAMLAVQSENDAVDELVLALSAELVTVIHFRIRNKRVFSRFVKITACVILNSTSISARNSWILTYYVAPGDSQTISGVSGIFSHYRG